MTRPALPALHHVARDEAIAWLADHGAVANNVAQATIRIGADLGVFVDLVEYRLNDKGQKYYDRDADTAAQFTYSVPLRRFPDLVPGAPGCVVVEAQEAVCTPDASCVEGSTSRWDLCPTHRGEFDAWLAHEKAGRA